MRSRVHLMAAVTLILAAACGGEASSSTTPSTGGSGGGGGGGGGGTSPVATTSVGVGNDFFSPVNAQIQRGQTVTWSWESGASDHNVTFSDAQSATQHSGTYQRTFNTAGTFNYTCTLHPGMNGSIIVQ
jgi:plastocyanin